MNINVASHLRMTLLSGILLLVIPTISHAIEPLWSIERLNQSKAEWSTLTSVTLRIEGRVASQIKGQLRFQKCDLTFRLTPEQERRASQSKNLEVTGQLRLNGSQPYFEVATVSPQPGDLEQFHSREAALKNPKPQDWYELADWGIQRAQFYADDSLQEKAQACRARGIALELTRLARDDYAGRFALVDKAASFALPEILIDDLRHEAYRLWWIQATPVSNPQPEVLQALMAQLKRDWPEALTPGSPFPTELQARYLQDPVGTYRAAEPGQRQVLRRMFAAEVQTKQLDLQLAANGQNGREIAEQLEALVPERKALAERYRMAALTYRLGEIATASRAEVVDLATRFRERKLPDQASEAMLRWLTAKERRLRPETAPEFLELADDYLALLQDETRAVSLLSEAHKKEPESTEVLRRFEQLGYSYDGIQWKKSKRPVMPSADPTDDGMPHQLQKGMTLSQLQQMLGQPTTRQRIVTAAGVEQFWIFGRPGEGSRLVIELHRSEPGAPYRVRDFYNR
ncbi:hypothetical protein GC163_07650 [bacterium]|nr:hypothetical protein [bacterium]